MTGRRRRELTDSFRRITSDEQWFLGDLFVGVVALVVWVAGTGALVTQAASATDVPLGLAEGEMPSATAIAVFGVLWLLVPAIAVVVRLRGRLLNLRGNLEQYYRFDHPAALLAPPALLAVLVSSLAVGLGTVSWTYILAMIPVGLFFLVRTLAFSYRVYSFSHPLVVQVFVALSTVVLLGSAFVTLGTATGRESLVDQVLLAAGLPSWITGTVSIEGIAVSGVAAAASLPVLLAGAYVLVQSVVALGVRLVKPDVDRSKMRTGQRYPPFLPTATPVQTAARPGDDDGRPSDVDEDGPTPDAGPADAGVESEGAGADDETDEPGDDEDDLDDVSNTRVFTPPAEDDAGDLDVGPGTTAGSGTDAEQATDSGPTADTGSETRAVPGAGEDASTVSDREQCDACGESFTVDTAVRFCPNCGAALEGE